MNSITLSPMLVRLFIRKPNEIWSDEQDKQTFTWAWRDLEHRYRLLFMAIHEDGEMPSWSFWYRPTQVSKRAKESAIKLVKALDNAARKLQLKQQKQKHAEQPFSASDGEG